MQSLSGCGFLDNLINIRLLSLSKEALVLASVPGVIFGSSVVSPDLESVSSVEASSPGASIAVV